MKITYAQADQPISSTTSMCIPRGVPFRGRIGGLSNELGLYIRFWDYVADLENPDKTWTGNVTVYNVIVYPNSELIVK